MQTHVKLGPSEGFLNIYGLSHADNDSLVVSYSIQISETLHYCLFLHGDSIPRTQISHILKSDTFTTVSQVVNTAVYMNNKSDQEVTADEHIEFGIQHLTLALTEMDESKARKLSFLLEQLELALKPTMSRRYSPSLVITAMSWKTTSPALYSQMLRAGILTLPSLRWSHLTYRGVHINCYT